MIPTNLYFPTTQLGNPLQEAKRKLGNSHYCHDKVVSHFRKIAKTCPEEGFELIENLQQPPSFKSCLPRF
jgi:hypothetical protein